MDEPSRHKTFMRWCEEYGTQEALADALGVSQGYIGQIKREHRPITEKTARKFERALGLEIGAMDAQSAPSAPVPFGAAYKVEVLTTPHDLQHVGGGLLPIDEIIVPRLEVGADHVLYEMPDNSMTPQGSSDFGLIAGDYALVDTRDTSPPSGSLVLAHWGDALILRQLIGDALIANNQYFNDIRGDYSIVGTVRQRHSTRSF